MQNQSVKLVAVTKPVDDTMSAQDLVAYCARVSNTKNQDNRDTSAKLLKYLIDHEHWSPFDMVNIVIEITCTRTISRQILRHWSIKPQEFSQRYAEVDNDMFITDLEARLQDPTNRQNSIASEDSDIQEDWEGIQCSVRDFSVEAYRHALNMGIAKEQARSVLPEGLTLSVLYMNGSLRSWYHYCKLRMGNGTQKEHQEIASKCWGIVVDQFPALKDI